LARYRNQTLTWVSCPLRNDFLVFIIFGGPVEHTIKNLATVTR